MDANIVAGLKAVSTATLTTVLLKRGIRNAYIRGPKPFCHATERLVGPAFTLRFVPMREDLATPASWGNPISTRAAIEAMPEGVVCVAGAEGVTNAGIFGDILVCRMKIRKVAGLVTDGVMRDAPGVDSAGLPVWCSGNAAPASVAGLTFVGWQEPIGCGGTAVFPGDVIVADRDGAVVVPQAIAAEVAAEAAAQEAFEDWALSEVFRGVPLPGLYPPNEETKKRYEAFSAGKDS
ncbi:MAG: ribonuclease activity regulator RraA [Flavobacteriaceae bacterium]